MHAQTGFFSKVLIHKIDADSALMRVEAVSICGSDLRIMRSGNPRVRLPAVIGHETAGVIVKAGANVRRVKEGDRVAIGADVYIDTSKEDLVKRCLEETGGGGRTWW